MSWNIGPVVLVLKRRGSYGYNSHSVKRSSGTIWICGVHALRCNRKQPLAPTDESVIGAVLLIGLLLTWIIPSLVRSIAIAVQSFALLGTFVGIATIIAGIGPRSTLDILFHALMVVLLVTGLIITFKTSSHGLSNISAT